MIFMKPKKAGEDDIIINGVRNPCSLCGKAMKKNVKYVKCQLLDNCHGENCDCELPVGAACYKKIMKRSGK